MTLPDRVEQTEENSLDRRRISEQSRRRLAEAIHYGETEVALREMFHVLTGEFVADVPPARDVTGDITLGPDVAIGENERLKLDVTLGDETQSVSVDGDGVDAYQFREVEAGTYDLRVEAVEWVEYDGDFMDATRYAIADSTITLSSSSIGVDPETLGIDAVVDGPNVTVDSVTIGAELSEGEQ